MYHPSRSDPRIYLSGTCLLLCCILTLVVWSESYWCRTLCFWCKCSKPPTYRWYEWRSTWLGKPSHYDESPCLWSYYRYSHPLYRHDRDGMSISLGDTYTHEGIYRGRSSLSEIRSELLLRISLHGKRNTAYFLTKKLPYDSMDTWLQKKKTHTSFVAMGSSKY